MLIYGFIQAVTDVLDIIEIIRIRNGGTPSESSASKYSSMSGQGIGVEAIVFEVFSMIAALLVAYQGYLTWKTVSQDSSESVSKMMKLTILFYNYSNMLTINCGKILNNLSSFKVGIAAYLTHKMVKE